MEKLVTSLETAKKLKAAGFPQETVFMWNGADEIGAREDYKPEWVPRCFAAPTDQELLDVMPAAVRGGDQLLVVAKQESGSYWASYQQHASLVSR